VPKKNGRQKSMTDELTRAKNYLIQVQNADGGWGYGASNNTSPEPTIYTALALYRSDDKSKRAAVRGLNWLVAQTKSNGAIALPEQKDDHWSTLLHLFALAKMQTSVDLQARIVEWVFNSKSQIAEKVEEVPLDGKLMGWAWAKGTFSWVEPTSYGLIALKVAGKSDHPRVIEGAKLLADRVCDDGGWNYGNHEVMGQHLTSYIPTTALAAMALQNDGGHQKIIDNSLAYLSREIGSNVSTLNLALTILCFNVYGRNAEELKPRLLARQQSDGSWRGNAHLTSLSVLALETFEKGAANAFRI
jgi:hypothetical protein